MRNKIMVLLGVLFFCMTLGIKDAMAAAATDVACKNPCINSFEIQDGQIGNSDIADGAVTNTKISDGAVTGTKIGDGAVSNTKIQDGAVTDAKITGPISSSKIQKPANVIVVAKSGGDFTSIQAAINSITPTVDNPYLIKVMPGTYVENITMKSYVHLQGAGRDVTTIQSPVATSAVINISSLNNVTISGFTLRGALNGIYILSSSPTITDNIITENRGDGILSVYYSSPKIMRNIITNNGSQGILNDDSSSVIEGNIITDNVLNGIWDNESYSVISGNVISGNGRGTGTDSGIGIYRGATTVTGNTITGNNPYGIGIFSCCSSGSVITNNKITNNGGTTYTDINVDSGSTPNISFNVYDYITGDTGVGQFNVNSNGDPAPAP